MIWTIDNPIDKETNLTAVHSISADSKVQIYIFFDPNILKQKLQLIVNIHHGKVKLKLNMGEGKQNTVDRR